MPYPEDQERRWLRRISKIQHNYNREAPKRQFTLKSAPDQEAIRKPQISQIWGFLEKMQVNDAMKSH